MSLGVSPEGRTEFHADAGRDTKCERRNGFDFCLRRSPVDAAQAGAGLAGEKSRHDQTLAGGWQKRRWWSWVAVAYGIVFAVIGLDVGQGVSRAANGRVTDPEHNYMLRAMRGSSPLPGRYQPRARQQETAGETADEVLRAQASQ